MLFGKLKNLSFSTHLLLCIFTSSFILLALGLSILNRYASSTTSYLNDGYMEKNLTVTVENINSLLNEPNYLAPLIFSQGNLLTKLKNPYSSTSSVYKSIHKTLVTAETAASSVSYICILDNWGNSISTSDTFDIPLFNNRTEAMTYFDNLPTNVKYEKNNQTWYFLEGNPNRPGRHAFVNVRSIKMGGNSENPMLIQYLSEDKISSVYSFLGDNAFLVTYEGTIVSSIDKSILGTKLNQNLIDAVSTSSFPSSFTIDNTHYHAINCASIGCYLIAHSDSTLISNINSLIFRVTMGILLLGLLFSLIWAKYISQSITHPLIELKNTMEQIPNGNYDIRCNINRNDEFGYLSNTFNYMMDMINKHIRENEKQLALTKEAELQLMQAQINPHLLYNSLDSALYLLSYDVKQSESVLEQLSIFFKLSLKKGNKIVTIREAIELAKTYLKLQNSCRMKDYSMNVSGDLSVMDADILHMCLQPIMENCVLHGFDGSFSSGNIDINLSKVENNIYIKVTDDGYGMEDKQLKDLQNSLQADAPFAGYGIWNISQRIKMYYGDDYGISIDSEFGEYTSVTLKIKEQYTNRENSRNV